MEPTLSLKNTDLQGEVGHFLGWGRGTDNGEEAWTAAKERDITQIVNSGLRRFYSQPQPDPNGPIHNWSFLSPVGSVSLADGAQEVTLPDDFGGIEGTVTMSQDGTNGFQPIKVGNPEELRQLYAAHDGASGRPTVCAIQVVPGTGPNTGTRYKLAVYPQSDGGYTLRFAYYLNPNALTAANPYPLGGMQHAETIKAACRAAAELYLDNEVGPEEANYRRALSASVAADSRLKPQFLGYNGDRSDGHAGYGRGTMPWYGYGRYGFGTITIAGMDPG